MSSELFKIAFQPNAVLKYLLFTDNRVSISQEINSTNVIASCISSSILRYFSSRQMDDGMMNLTSFPNMLHSAHMTNRRICSFQCPRMTSWFKFWSYLLAWKGRNIILMWENALNIFPGAYLNCVSCPSHLCLRKVRYRVWANRRGVKF